MAALRFAAGTGRSVEEAQAQIAAKAKGRPVRVTSIGHTARPEAPGVLIMGWIEMGE